MTTPKAIIIAGALIALAIIITNHWQMVGIPSGSVPNGPLDWHHFSLHQHACRRIHLPVGKVA
jgi:hypothetical protein